MSDARFHLDPQWSPYATEVPEGEVEQPRSAQGGLLARFGLLFSSLLVAATLLAHVNPYFGFLFPELGVDAKRWPWEFFRGSDGWAFAWTRVTAWVLALGAAAVLLAVAAALRAGRLRAGLALTAFALLTATLLQPDKSLALMAGQNMAFALLMAGIVGVCARSRPAGARRLLGMAALTLGLILFLPLPADNSARDPDAPPEPEARAAYVSEATRAVMTYHSLISPPPSLKRPPPDRIEIVGLVCNPPMLALLALVVGLLALVGLGGRWAPYVAGVLFLVSILGSSATGGLLAADQERRARGGGPGALTSDEELTQVAIGAAQGISLLLRLGMLPLALGVADLLRARRRPT